MKIKTDPEFQALIQPLSEAELLQLEHSIQSEGCRDPLVLWKEKDILLDGHHRYEICKKHEIDFKTTAREFKDREEAKLWILENQLARRNLNKFQRCELALKFEPMLSEEARKQQGTRTDLLPEKIQSKNTLDMMAKVAGVSKTTMYKFKYIFEHQEFYRLMRKGLMTSETNISRVYNQIKKDEESKGLFWKIKPLRENAIIERMKKEGKIKEEEIRETKEKVPIIESTMKYKVIREINKTDKNVEYLTEDLDFTIDPKYQNSKHDDSSRRGFIGLHAQVVTRKDNEEREIEAWKHLLLEKEKEHKEIKYYIQIAFNVGHKKFITRLNESFENEKDAKMIADKIKGMNAKNVDVVYSEKIK
jgi:ParB-like chromosome segregation protein Spo0J